MIWKILASLFFIPIVAIFGVDTLFYLKNRYCRFYIGRWETEKWNAAIEKKTLRWLKHTPTVKITDNSRYMLLDMLQKKYRSQSIQSWQKAVLILGLLESQNEASRRAAKQAAFSLLNEEGGWKKPPVAVDCGMLSYAVLKAAEDPQAVRPAMDFSRALIEANLNDHGMVSYTGGKNNPEMYVDTIGLTSPFLALYGKVYDVPACEDVAFHQIELFHRYGLLGECVLPNHAFHMETKLPLGVYGWGRGTAWYVIGLMDTVQELRSPTYRSQVTQWIEEAAQAYAVYQRPDGGFGSILQRMQTYDSSATAALAWFYARCGILTGQEDYWKIASRCMEKLRKRTRITGAIDDCQGDTKGIGVFSQTYDIMPFAQGMALRALDVIRGRK